MDAFQQQQQARRLIGPPIGGDQRLQPPPPPQQQGTNFWYPPSPPPPPGGYHHLSHRPFLPPHQLNYPNRPPLPPYDHHHHLQQPPSHSPVPPYQNQPPIPPYPPHPHQSPHPPPQAPHPMSLPHQHYPPPPSSFPPPSQVWGPSWAPQQGWDYQERNIPYNNEEDWAARAKAWAAAKSMTENHHAQSHLTPIGRMDEHSYAYHDQYRQATSGSSEIQQPQLLDPQKQVNHMPGPSPFSSGSSTYATDGRACYNVGGDFTATDTDHMTSPRKTYGPSSSIYEQEVPYSYSSARGHREAANQSENSHISLPLPGSSVREGYHSQSALPVRDISVEQPHYALGGQPTQVLIDASDQPLRFEPRPASDHGPHPKISYGPASHSGHVGVMDHDAAVGSIHAWTPAAPPGVAFAQIPSPGMQFDPSLIPQSSLPLQPTPVFGMAPPPNFRPSMPPVSTSFSLGPGTSLHHTSTFPGDANGGLNLSERPKKAAVPNWLREEIIKKKPVTASTIPTQPTGDSFQSIESEDADISFRRADQSDNKSIVSTGSTEDEDDEDDIEAARSAAINQEIKRVLTEVLLKVTDELFDEIATKVLNEDEPTGEGEHIIALGSRKVSPPPAIPTLKASAEVLVPVKMGYNNVDGGGDNSSPSSQGGDVLGLGNYGSDASDGEDETLSSRVLSSGKIDSASHQLVTKHSPPENLVKEVENGNSLVGVKASGGPHVMENERKGEGARAPQKHSSRLSEGNRKVKNGLPSAGNLYDPENAPQGVSETCEEPISVDSGNVNENPLENSTALQSKDTVDWKDGRKMESTSGHANNDKSITGQSHVRESKNHLGMDKNPGKRGGMKEIVTELEASMDKTRKTSDASNAIIQEDRAEMKETTDKRGKLRETGEDRNGKRAENVRDSDSRRSFKHKNNTDDRKETAKDKGDRNKEDGVRRRERTRDEKEDRSTRVTKDSSRYSSRRSSSPSSRGRNSKDTSFRGHASASSDEPSDSSKKRRLQSYNSSLSPSPTRSRKRQVSRSPHSKHSHRRHSPYSSLERR